MSERRGGEPARPATPTGPGPARRPYALAVFFGLVGFLPANWLVRVPDIKAQVGATAGGLGLAMLTGSLAGLAATLLASRLCLKFGTRQVLVAGATLLSLVVVLPALAGSVAWLGVALVVHGLAQSTFNIALNSAAVEAAAASGNPMVPTLHGIYSVGALAGAVVGGFAADHLAPAPHLGLMAVLGLAVTLRFGPRLRSPLPSPQPTTDRAATTDSVTTTDRATSTPAAFVPDWRAARWIVLPFGVIALCTAFGEYASNNWAALHLREDLGTTAAVAGFGYAAYACAIAVGRFLGARLIRRFGDTVVLSGGFALAAVGSVAASWSGHLPHAGLPLAVAGYVVVGLGLANVFPIAIARGGVLGGPRGVSRVSVISSLGVLGQAPLIGFLADRYGLPTALSTVTVLSVCAAVLALVVRRWSTAPPAPSPVAASASASASTEGRSA
ncbi:MFS transporter [Actinopolymorpha alba]|uniref:MFS transporter n=1 Tax=Actinopolymorpha alba TaxID=533267 RepID=UPI0003693F36|nr:MFS transporter [Actinopolymorpha alba]